MIAVYIIDSQVASDSVRRVLEVVNIEYEHIIIFGCKNIQVITIDKVSDIGCRKSLL